MRRPEGVAWLDFELELAAVIGADEQIAGFTILNDWSARDLQKRESTVGLGIKAKDFATSLGPWLVTLDELPYEDGRLKLTGRVAVNGEVVTETSTELQHFSFEQMRAHAARDSRLRVRRRPGQRDARPRMHRRVRCPRRAALAPARRSRRA